jgi:MFS family permease
MGIGLVDPILKPIADDLGASPSQVSLLFTSYMAVMGLAMLITGVVSSRIGAKRTLLLGLAMIVVFSALAGSSTPSAASWASGPAGAWATRCSSRPRSPRSWPRPAARWRSR